MLISEPIKCLLWATEKRTEFIATEDCVKDGHSVDSLMELRCNDCIEYVLTGDLFRVTRNGKILAGQLRSWIKKSKLRVTPSKELEIRKTPLVATILYGTIMVIPKIGKIITGLIRKATLRLNGEASRGK